MFSLAACTLASPSNVLQEVTGISVPKASANLAFAIALRCRRPSLRLEALLASADTSCRFVMLDGLTDAVNVGTIVRLVFVLMPFFVFGWGGVGGATKPTKFIQIQSFTKEHHYIIREFEEISWNCCGFNTLPQILVAFACFCHPARRVATAFGATAILLSTDCCDALSARAVRVSRCQWEQKFIGSGCFCSCNCIFCCSRLLCFLFFRLIFVHFWCSKGLKGLLPEVSLGYVFHLPLIQGDLVTRCGHVCWREYGHSLKTFGALF